MSKYEIAKDIAILFGGCLLTAAFLGFSLLKFYEEFQKGVEQKSRLRIWSAFFGLAFVIVFFSALALRVVR